MCPCPSTVCTRKCLLLPPSSLSEQKSPVDWFEMSTWRTNVIFFCWYQHVTTLGRGGELVDAFCSVNSRTYVTVPCPGTHFYFKKNAWIAIYCNGIKIQLLGYSTSHRSKVFAVNPLCIWNSEGDAKLFFCISLKDWKGKKLDLLTKIYASSYIDTG